MTKTQYTPEQKEAWKAERQAEQRQLLDDALGTLASSETWTNWVKFGRSNLRKYSFNNALLIWAQKRDAKLVHGKTQWAKEKVEINDGAKRIGILAPMFVNVYANGVQVFRPDGKPMKKIGWFKIVHVYDVSDTDAPEVELDPMTPLEGDDLIDALAPLEGFARELGVLVRYKDETGNADGWYDQKNSEIVIKKDLSANAIVRTLIHELAHVYGNVNYTDYSREEAEVLVESATVMTLGMVGFDTSAASVPYILSWGGDTKVLDKFAKLVDELVNKLTKVIENG